MKILRYVFHLEIRHFMTIACFRLARQKAPAGDGFGTNSRFSFHHYPRAVQANIIARDSLKVAPGKLVLIRQGPLQKSTG